MLDAIALLGVSSLYLLTFRLYTLQFTGYVYVLVLREEGHDC